MGNDSSKYADGEGGQVGYIAQRTQVGRAKAIAGRAGQAKLDIKLPPKAVKTDPGDYEFIKASYLGDAVYRDHGSWCI